MTDTLRDILEHRLVVIYRGLSARECLTATKALYDSGVRLFEVTFNSDRPVDAIRLLRAELGLDVRVGAGTVLREGEVEQAAEAGAEFIISPNLEESVVAATKRAGLVSIPGAFTPTEIMHAVAAGADLVKVFPLRPVGADYIRQLRGPLPDVPMFATGGVDVDLAREATEAGCVGVGVGVQLLGPDPADTEQLAASAREFLAAVGAIAA